LLKGTHSLDVAAGETESVDYTLTEDLTITGVSYKTANIGIDDTATFQIVHPVDGVVNEFGKDVFLKSEEAYSFYAARLVTGLKVRVSVTNNGSEAIKVRLNCIFHRDQ